MKPIIEVHNLSKQYRLGKVGTGSLSHDVNRWWHRLRGKEDPYLKIGQTNDRTTKGDSEYVWALRDINFSVQPGEVLGIIGRNGAGKSTLLKILSRITAPTTGSVTLRGRVASLLEVGTGMHPELTGRENIFLNGAILGMRKKEIDGKLDAIVDFAGVERYIDTPVKRYSSGMKVRLGFGVAAYLEPDILIVDEVLAVGDAEFQKKCIGKMQDVSREEGRTVLFVSHNMLAVKSLCNAGILLNNGMISCMDEIEQVIVNYNSIQQVASFKQINRTAGGFKLESIGIVDHGVEGFFDIDKDLDITIETSGDSDFSLVNINLFFKTGDGAIIFVTHSKAEPFKKGKAVYHCRVPANTLNDNIYILDIMVVENGHRAILIAEDAIKIEGNEPQREVGWLGKFPGLIRPTEYEWKKKNLS